LRSLISVHWSLNRLVRGIHPDKAIFSVSRDGRSALVGVFGSYSADVMRVDLATGRRELFKKIGPSDSPPTLAKYARMGHPRWEWCRKVGHSS
jgi:hypothetical protein